MRGELRPLLASINQNAPGIFENLNALTARLDTTAARLNAVLDDVRVYDRALSVADVTTLFNNGWGSKNQNRGI